MERKNTEIFVGLFVLAGLCVCAWLIIQFGKAGQSFQKTYPLYVKFDSGNGLLKGAQIRYTGTLAGRVGSTPALMTDATGNQYVLVDMNIREDIKILKGSKFTVGQSGFLGDNYIDIIPPRLVEGQPVEFIAPKETLNGSRTTDLSVLTAEGADVMQQLKKISLQLETTTSNINLILTPETATNINITLSNVRDITGNVKTFTARINQSQGPFGELLNNKDSAADLSAFIYNLRKRGILFYSDVHDADKAREALRSRTNKDKK